MAGAIPDMGERSDSGVAAKKRTLVLEGTFSIEEIDVSSTSRKTAAAKSRKKTAKKAVRKKAPAKKTAARTAARKKPVRKKTGAAKKAARKTPRRAAAKAGGAPAAPAAKPAGNIVLGSRPDIKTIGELSNELGAALASDGDVVVEAAGVETIDTAVLQLLVAFANSARADSKSVRWNDPSPALQELAELTDLASALGFEDAPDADDGLLPVF